jgi:hypothetical protein
LTSEQMDLLGTHNKTNAAPSSAAAAMISSLSSPPPLVDEAVKKATQTIMTDAIETLLQDELHSIITYVKHERELSRSCLPGVVPLSKQLFEPPQHVQTVDEPTVLTGAKTPPLKSTNSHGHGGRDKQKDESCGGDHKDTKITA